MDDRLAYAHALPSTSFLDIASVGDDIIWIPGLGNFFFFGLASVFKHKNISIIYGNWKSFLSNHSNCHPHCGDTEQIL